MSERRSLFLRDVPAPRDLDDLRSAASSLARARMLQAMARVVSARGYATVTVSDVVKAAKVSRRTFYEHFEDKEDCFVETYRTGCLNAIAQIDTALRALKEPDWRTRLWVSLEEYVSILAAEPDFARVLLIDVLGAGPRALAAREQVLEVYVEHYRGLVQRAQTEDPELPDPPARFLRGLVGGIAELVQQCLIEGPAEQSPERLRELTPTLVSFATTILTRSQRDLDVRVYSARG
jgi:AcrR family transcriptional regulator